VTTGFSVENVEKHSENYWSIDRTILSHHFI